MIQDKDFTLRLIRQLTQTLEKLLLGKPEESLMQKELDFDSLMKDIFNMDFNDIASKSKEELIKIVKERESKDHADYYEMLGNVFMFYYRTEEKIDCWNSFSWRWFQPEQSKTVGKLHHWI